MADDSLISQYPEIFKRVTIDNIDIIRRGEKSKHKWYILLEDIPAIMERIRRGTEEEAVAFIATKIRKAE